jgi:hypothetical protein
MAGNLEVSPAQLIQRQAELNLHVQCPALSSTSRCGNWRSRDPYTCR